MARPIRDASECGLVLVQIYTVSATDFGALPPKISIANPASISEHNHPKRV